jgi:2-dehydro-3-deoxyphosphogluconate aldolase/(4S)-4-hydroxy-2-oxoglutarate aldolase
MNTREMLELAPVIPVLVIDNPDTAVELAGALTRGGLKVLEITLRTPAAFAAIDAIKAAVDSAIVGAGTVNTLDQLEQCAKHEVDFMVSPGFHLPLVKAAADHNIPYLPGIATASEALAAINAGIHTLKFFPAEQSGGVSMLKALGGPYQELRFCPTGGVNAKNHQDYLALGNVLCVGGSWVAPADLIANQDWQGIEALARSVTSG